MKYGRIDGPQNAIVEAFRDAGCSVCINSDAGNGKPDLFVALSRTRTIACEIKDGKKPKWARKLRESQVKFRDEWRGEIHVLLSVEDAIAIVVGQHRCECRNY